MRSEAEHLKNNAFSNMITGRECEAKRSIWSDLHNVMTMTMRSEVEHLE